jgi:hypothetical protein
LRCPNCQAPLAPNQAQCACGWNTSIAATLGIASDSLGSEVDSLYEQHLKTKLRNARRHLAATVDQLTRTPDNPQVNAQVDEASREVALIERELTVYRAKLKEHRPPADTTPRVNEAAPGESFRAAQLAKATQAIRATPPAPAAHTGHVARPAASPPPPVVPRVDIPRTEAAAKPAPPVASPSALAPASPTKTCPQCGSRIAIEAGRCHCGHSFLGDPGLTSDEFLSREEILALRGGTKNQPT